MAFFKNVTELTVARQLQIFTTFPIIFSITQKPILMQNYIIKIEPLTIYFKSIYPSP
jgi:hypothetical protein